jgi:homoserine kinase
MGSLTVTVRVPGSTSNLGPGFDTLGLAVRLYNTVSVRRIAGRGIELVAPLTEADRQRAQHMALEAARRFFRTVGHKPFGLEIRLDGEVPVGRGLGASATLRVGVVAGLNKLTRAGLSRQQWLELVTGLEGHPDNASPAIWGGFTVSSCVGRSVRCLRFRVSPRLKIVVLIPPFAINTEQARRLLPATVSRADAVLNLNRAALISAALATGQYTALRGMFQDRVHQPYRQRLIPCLWRVIRAGERAGALGGFLSGSGSSVICLTVQNAEAVARAMHRHLPEAQVKILTADNTGAVVVGKGSA